MTERLYYTDPYRTRFSARVIERLTWNGHPAVVLDSTSFYPTSGGQPADHGTLNDVELLDVVVRDEDGAIIHVLASGEIPTEVEGALDWQRRFDHMQQHTGQHVLSAAFEQVLDAETVGFHLGTETSTIDLNVADLDSEAVKPVEALANQVIWEDRPIEARFVDPDELATLPVKRPPAVEGPIRVVEIAELAAAPAGTSAPRPRSTFDVNPCAGTHLARTGEIGLIKIVNLEHRGDETRVEFVCGRRALRDYRSKNAMIHQLVSMLTVGHWELDQAVGRLQDDIKELQRVRRRLRTRLLDMEAAELANAAITQGPYRVIWRIWDQREDPSRQTGDRTKQEGVETRGPAELRALARKLAEHPNVVALLFSVGERTHLCFARAEDLELNVADMLRETCVKLGGMGGGRPQVAQGSTPPTEPSHIEAIISDLLSDLT